MYFSSSHWRKERIQPVGDSRWSFVDLLLRMCFVFSPWSLLRACGEGAWSLTQLELSDKTAISDVVANASKLDRP